jgi:O-Antigen ligase
MNLSAGEMHKTKNSQPQFLPVISSILIFSVLDGYVATAYPDLKFIQVIFKSTFVPFLCYLVFFHWQCRKYFLSIDTIILVIVQLIFFYCACVTNTILTADYFWMVMLSSTIIIVTPARCDHGLVFSSIQFYFFVFAVNATSILTALWSIDFWILNDSRIFGGVNSNVACAYAGLCLTSVAGIFRTCNLSKQEKNLLKVSVCTLILSIILSNSRTGLVWMLASLVISLGEDKKRYLLKKFTIAVLCCSYIFSAIFTTLVITNTQDIFIPVLENLSALRQKGDISSDVYRLHYSDVIFTYLGKDKMLAGAGFGNRNYRETLGEGEDVHNAFLTTLSDSGYAGCFVLVFLCFLWPIMRSQKLSSQRDKNFLLTLILSSATFFPAPIYGSQFFSLGILYTSILWGSLPQKGTK